MSLPFLSRNTAVKGLLTPRWRTRDELHKQQLQDQVLSEGLRRAPPRRPTIGEFTGLCLPIAFPDVAATVTREEIEAFCNRRGYSGFGNNGSVFDYFHEVSGGRLSYRTVVAPDYTAAHPLSHYTDTTLPFAERARELILEALAFHRANGFDFSTLTVDAQHGVYAMNVLYAGEVPNEWGFGLWPHASRLDAPVPLAARKSALDYQITAPNTSSSRTAAPPAAMPGCAPRAWRSGTSTSSAAMPSRPRRPRAIAISSACCCSATGWASCSKASTPATEPTCSSRPASPCSPTARRCRASGGMARPRGCRSIRSRRWATT